MLSLVENRVKAMNATEKIKNTFEVVVIHSRFGDLQVDISKAIYFPKGLIGFSPDISFSIANFPKHGLEQFKILQCINDHSISIPVLPSGYKNNFVEEKDMEECIKACEVNPDDVGVLFVATSVKKPDGTFEMFINTKAPIIIDTKLQMAVQHVFTSNKYSVRQPL